MIQFGSMRNFEIFCRAWCQVWVERGLIWRLHKGFIKSQANGSQFSVLWNFVLPVVPLGFYVILSSLSVFPEVESMNRLTFVVIGVTAWLLFAGLIIIPMNEVKTAIRAASKSQLSILAHILVKMSGLIFDTSIRILVGSLVLFFFSSDGFHISPWLLVALVIAAFCFFGLGLLLGCLCVFSGNLSKLVTIVLQYALFVSGVIFPISKLGAIEKFCYFNPLYQAVSVTRSLIVHGEFNATLYALLLVPGGLFCFVWFSAVVTVLRDHLGGKI